MWKGGLSTTLEVSTTVGAFLDLCGAEEMEPLVMELFKEGKTDRQIAGHLTQLGHRPPQRKRRPSKHGPNNPPQARAAPGSEREGHFASAPRPRFPHLSEVARKLEVPKPWMYNRIYIGAIQVVKNGRTGLYLFPDDPATIERFRELKEGKVCKLQF